MDTDNQIAQGDVAIRRLEEAIRTINDRGTAQPEELNSLHEELARLMTERSKLVSERSDLDEVPVDPLI